jgi:hypothetical protein
VERGQSRVIDASLTLIRERAKLKVSPSLKISSFFFLAFPLMALSLCPLLFF